MKKQIHYHLKLKELLEKSEVIKRFFYYFKLKMLLEMKDLMPFVKFALQRYYGGISLFSYCTKHNKSILYWMEWLVNQNSLYNLADTYTFPNSSLRSTIIKKYNQSRDFWSKQVKR